MDLKPIVYKDGEKSKLVSHESYDPSTKILRLVMASTGKHYDYHAVEPHEYRDFLAADSKGKWFHANLGGKKKEFFPAEPPKDE